MRRHHPLSFPIPLLFLSLVFSLTWARQSPSMAFFSPSESAEMRNAAFAFFAASSGRSPSSRKSSKVVGP